MKSFNCFRYFNNARYCRIEIKQINDTRVFSFQTSPPPPLPLNKADAGDQ